MRVLLPALGVAVALGAILVALVRPGVDTLAPAVSDTVIRSATEPWGVVAGRVVDSFERPVSGATVLAQNQRGFGGRALSGPDGTYRLALGLCRLCDPPWPGKPWEAARIPVSSTPIILAATAEGFCGSLCGRLEAVRGDLHEAPDIVLWRGGHLRGRVRDANGVEREGRVRVFWVHDPGLPPRGLEGIPRGHPAEFLATGKDGSFHISPVVPGTARLWAAVDGLGAAAASAPVREGETTEVDLDLKIGILLSGRVLDPDGNGVPGVQVQSQRDPKRSDGTTARPPRGDGPSRPMRRVEREKEGPVSGGPGGKLRAREPGDRGGRNLATTTDAQGRFWFYGEPTVGRWTLRLPAALGYRGSMLADQPGGQEDLRLLMPRRFVVSGRVTDSRGNPVGGAVIRILPSLLARYMSWRYPLGLRLDGDAIRTEEDGSFSVPDVVPGLHRLTCLAPGHEVGWTHFKVHPDRGTEKSPLGLVLDPAASIAGRILGPDGRPSAGARVEVEAVRSGRAEPGRTVWVGRLTTRSSRDGSFAIDGLPAGVALRIRATGSEDEAVDERMELRSGRETSVELCLEKPAVLVVHTVPRRGGDQAGSPVRLVRRGQESLDLRARTGADGRIRFERLPAGDYRVLAIDPREDATRPEVRSRILEVSLAGGETRELDVVVPDMTRVEGTILRGGTPVRVARVGFGPIEGTPDTFRPLLFDLKNGRFSVRMPPGRYHAHVSVPGKRFEIEAPVDVPNQPCFDWKVDIEAD